MKSLLIVVDMQNDFITGVFENKDAEAIVPDVARFIEGFSDDVVATFDTHRGDYLFTNEGRVFPPHCIVATEGQKLHPTIQKALDLHHENFPGTLTLQYTKDHFGSTELADWARKYHYDNIFVCGVCTDICVIQNVFLLQNNGSDPHIKVIEKLCAGTTKENHENAIKIMKTNLVEVI